VLLPSREPELGDDPTQLYRLVDTVEAVLRRAQEEIEQATQALNQVQGVLIEQHNATEQEKIALQAKFNEEKEQMKLGKEQLLMEQLEVKEVVSRALCSVKVLEIKAEDRVTHQVEHLTKSIQQLHQRITDLELCTVPETSQDIRDQREAIAWSAVERIKVLAMECKQLSNFSAQTYEKLTKNSESQELES
jgi:hypothetical protein